MIIGYRVFESIYGRKKVHEIAVIVGKSERSVYRYIKEQKLKSVKSLEKEIKPNENYNQNELDMYS